MNERIKELIEKATFDDHMCSATPRYYFDKTLFAKLIVKECADIAKHHVMNISTYADAEFVEEQIKKDFGIKEQTGWVCNECGVDRTKDVCPKGYVAAITGECPMSVNGNL
jgi:hypothetical protein